MLIFLLILAPISSSKSTLGREYKQSKTRFRGAFYVHGCHVPGLSIVSDLNDQWKQCWLAAPLLFVVGLYGLFCVRGKWQAHGAAGCCIEPTNCLENIDKWLSVELFSSKNFEFATPTKNWGWTPSPRYKFCSRRTLSPSLTNVLESKQAREAAPAMGIVLYLKVSAQNAHASTHRLCVLTTIERMRQVSRTKYTSFIFRI